MFKDITKVIESKIGLNIHEEIEISEVVKLPDVIKQTRDIKEERSNHKDEDYNYARKNLYTLLEKSMGSVEVVFSLVKEAESPRVIEAASAFVKCVSELNKDLMSLNDSNTSSDKKIDKNNSSSNTVNNAIFIGSTDELSDIIKRKISDTTVIDVEVS